MDTENKKKNPPSHPNLSTADRLTDLPLDKMSEDQLNDLLSHLLDIKQQKQIQQTLTKIAQDAAAEQTKDSNDPVPSSEPEGAEPLLYPDPSCFDHENLNTEDAVRKQTEPLTEETDMETESVLAAANINDAADDTDIDEETIDHYREQVQKRRKKRRLWVALAAVTAVLLLMLVLIISYLNLYKPTIDPRLPFNPNLPDTGDHMETDEHGRPLDTSDDNYVPAISDDFARREDVYNFLILGVDRAANLSDVIMIVSYDVKQQTIHVLQLPRDTYINVGSNYNKINSYFAASYNHSAKRGEDRYTDAIESMAQFIETGLCIKIDRYVCMDTAGFRDIVDAVGGVDIDVPFAMDYEDPEQDLYIHLKPGPQHLDGDKAEQFVRFRKAYINGDIGRISAQKLFLTALAKQVQENLSVSNAISIAKSILTYVNTNISVAECGYFVKYALGVDMNSINFTTLPGDGVTNPVTGASYYVMYAETVRKLVNEQFNVYNQEISREVFLSNSKRFTSSESYISQVYGKDADSKTVSAEDIDRDSIQIPVH